MSQQIEFLKNVIASAQTGDEAAIKLLRKICQLAAEKAPPSDLITVAGCLLHVGTQVARDQNQRN